MTRDLVMKMAGLVGFFLVVPYVLVHGPWPGVYPRDQVKVQALLTAAGLLGLAVFTLVIMASRRPISMAERKRARAALHAEWVGHRGRAPEMAPLTPEDLRPPQDFDTSPADIEPPPRQSPRPKGPTKSAGGLSWRGFFTRQVDPEAFERENTRWD